MENSSPHITEWIGAISASISTLVSIILLAGLYYTAKQIKEAAKWNKLNATFTYFNSEAFVHRERAMVDALIKIKLDFYELKLPLNEANTNEIWNTHSLFREVRDYLDILENYAIAVNAGALENDCAYAIGYGFISRGARTFQPIIEKIRQATNHNDYYVEIEKLNMKWLERAENERVKNLNEIEKLKKQRQFSSGVQSKT